MYNTIRFQLNQLKWIKYQLTSQLLNYWDKYKRIPAEPAEVNQVPGAHGTKDPTEPVDVQYNKIPAEPAEVNQVPVDLSISKLLR